MSPSTCDYVFPGIGERYNVGDCDEDEEIGNGFSSPLRLVFFRNILQHYALYVIHLVVKS